jgi:hypothetical protein
VAPTKTETKEEIAMPKLIPNEINGVPVPAPDDLPEPPQNPYLFPPTTVMVWGHGTAADGRRGKEAKQLNMDRRDWLGDYFEDDEPLSDSIADPDESDWEVIYDQRRYWPPYGKRPEPVKKKE